MKFEPFFKYLFPSNTIIWHTVCQLTGKTISVLWVDSKWVSICQELNEKQTKSMQRKETKLKLKLEIKSVILKSEQQIKVQIVT